MLLIVQRIFDLEGIVNHNKAKSYLLRAKTSENAALISKNYNSAFMGNRQLANENTDAIFRNKIALMQSLPSNNQAEINYREAKINEAKLQFLDHRSALNAQVVAITKDLAILNEHAIAINRRIMETNEAIKDMNAALNGKLFSSYVFLLNDFFLSQLKLVRLLNLFLRHPAQKRMLPLLRQMQPRSRKSCPVWL